MTGPAEGGGDARWFRVRDFTVSPRRAEAEAVIEGSPLPIGEPNPAGLPRHRWGLATALLWIVWRDEGRVAAELPRLGFWGERMRHEVDDGQLMALDAAERELGGALMALPGLDAVGVLPGGGGSDKVPPKVWPALMLGPLGEDKAVLHGWGEPRWEGVTVAADAMRREWPVLVKADAAPVAPAVPVAPVASAATAPEPRPRAVRRPELRDAVRDAILNLFPSRPEGLLGAEICRQACVGRLAKVSDPTRRRGHAAAKDVWERERQMGQKSQTTVDPHMTHD